MNARLRLAEPRDAAPVAAIYGPVVRDTAISFEVDPPDAPEMERRIATAGRRAPTSLRFASLRARLRRACTPG